MVVVEKVEKSALLPHSISSKLIPTNISRFLQDKGALSVIASFLQREDLLTFLLTIANDTRENTEKNNEVIYSNKDATSVLQSIIKERTERFFKVKTTLFVIASFLPNQAFLSLLFILTEEIIENDKKNNKLEYSNEESILMLRNILNKGMEILEKKLNIIKKECTENNINFNYWYFTEIEVLQGAKDLLQILQKDNNIIISKVFNSKVKGIKNSTTELLRETELYHISSLIRYGRTDKTIHINSVDFMYKRVLESTNFLINLTFYSSAFSYLIHNEDTKTSIDKIAYDAWMYDKMLVDVKDPKLKHAIQKAILEILKVASSGFKYQGNSFKLIECFDEACKIISKPKHLSYWKRAKDLYRNAVGYEVKFYESIQNLNLSREELEAITACALTAVCASYGVQSDNNSHELNFSPEVLTEATNFVQETIAAKHPDKNHMRNKLIPG